MGLRLTAALLTGKAATWLSRKMRLGGGTVVAGHLAPRLAPNVLGDVTSRLPLGSVLVSGTNGKTTTSRIIAHLFDRAGHPPLHNRAGANLMTGLVSAVVENTSLAGRPRAAVGLFEVDEATLPMAIQKLQTRAMVLTNLFRDQLDRYGEVHYIQRTWTEALASLPASSDLILNADDPLVASVGGDRPNALYFGVEALEAGNESSAHASDARLCLRCGGRLAYSHVFYGHLGHYVCPGCAFSRPAPAVSAVNYQPRGQEGSDVRIRTPLGSFTARLSLPGLYNVYNVLAATAVAARLGIDLGAIQAGLESFSTAFGRLERIDVEGRRLFLILVKNPIGCSEVLQTIAPAMHAATIAVLINDHFADGTDVSWLWDADFEALEGHVLNAICSGTRAEDMAVRLKYAGLLLSSIRVETELRRTLERLLERSEPGDDVYVLATYTAMLEVRDLLQKTGYIRPFHED